MKRTAILLVSLVLIAGPGLAADVAPQPAKAATAAKTAKSKADREIPETLMFSIDELNEIQSRASSGAAGDRNVAAIESASLYLSTILYYGPKDWTAWVNGVPISPKEELGSFKITDIGPNFVELLVPLSAQGMRPVRLSPNQSFVVKSGAVVEGQWQQ